MWYKTNKIIVMSTTTCKWGYGSFVLRYGIRINYGYILLDGTIIQSGMKIENWPKKKKLK